MEIQTPVQPPTFAARPEPPSTDVAEPGVPKLPCLKRRLWLIGLLVSSWTFIITTVVVLMKFLAG